MATRSYQFIVGPETSTLPTVTDPTVDGDFVTLGYTNKTYTRGVADVAAVKAIGSTARTDKETVYVESLRMFFSFDLESALTGDDINVITPTAGSGRWLRVQPSFVRFASDGDFEMWKGSTGAVGDIYYNTALNNIKYHTGSAWVTIPNVDEDMSITGNLTVSGDLTVNGATTTLNTTTLDVEDVNITINKGGNDASSEGAGLLVDRTGTKGSVVYATALASKFKIGDLASEAEVATVSHTQTLTNKTLAIASNTITGTANHVVMVGAGGTVTTEAQLNVSRGGTGASAFSLGSVVFAGTGGVYTQDNSNYFWDNTNKLLALANSSPGERVSVISNNSAFPSIGARYSLSNPRLSVNIANSGLYPYLAINATQIASSDTSNYEINGRASRLRMDGGIFQFDTSSASGTAGNAITWNNSMYIDTGGKVAIGHVSPVASQGRLQVHNNDNGVATFKQLASSLSSGYYTVEIDSIAHTSNVSAAGAFIVKTDGSASSLVVDGAGRVGIGTSSPNSQLDILKSGADATFRIGTNASSFMSIYRKNSTGHYLFSADETGSSLQFLTDTGSGPVQWLEIDRFGNTVQGTAALATTATDGFLYIESCPGAPTGAATSYTGRTPMVYDSTNNRLYIRNGGTWRSVLLA